jgi:hypothetical protein
MYKIFMYDDSIVSMSKNQLKEFIKNMSYNIAYIINPEHISVSMLNI